VDIEKESKEIKSGCVWGDGGGFEGNGDVPLESGDGESGMIKGIDCFGYVSGVPGVESSWTGALGGGDGLSCARVILEANRDEGSVLDIG
jgi:hypothetical protein